MEVTNLQEELASEQRTLDMLEKLVAQQSQLVEEMTKDAAAIEGFQARVAKLRDAMEAKAQRDKLAQQHTQQQGRVRALHLHLEELRLHRIEILQVHTGPRQIVHMGPAPEAA